MNELNNEQITRITISKVSELVVGRKEIHKVCKNSYHETKRKIKNKQHGFSALELVFVLAVVAVALVAVIKTMGSNREKVDATNMLTDVSAMTQNIKSAYGSSSTGYTGLTNQVALDLKVVPENLPVAGTDIKNQFPAGTVAIAGDTSGDFFTITYTNVPSSVCQRVITQMGGSSFQKITVGSTVLYDAVAGTQLAIADVGTACKVSNQATIIFAAS